MVRSTVTPFFSINDIDMPKLGGIQIIDVSKDFYFGRRFQVMYVDSLTNDYTISKDVKFSKIVKKIKSISKKEDNLENLKEIKRFLGTLKKIEDDSILAFRERGCLYRFLTRVSRVFSSGSHLDRIKKIEDIIQGKINTTDPDNVNYDARKALIQRMESAKMESAFLLLIEDCLKAKQLDEASKTCVYLFDYRKADAAYIKIARAYIESGDLANAASVVNRIGKKEEKIEMVQELVMACITQDSPNIEVALQSISLIPKTDANLPKIEELRKLVDNVSDF